jgi:hypothetical protein
VSDKRYIGTFFSDVAMQDTQPLSVMDFLIKTHVAALRDYTDTEIYKFRHGVVQVFALLVSYAA